MHESLINIMLLPHSTRSMRSIDRTSFVAAMGTALGRAQSC